MKQSVVPADLDELQPTGLSNFDHSVNEGVETALKERHLWTCYAGRNFNGRVWWDRAGEVFKCEVWRYGVPGEVMEAKTLPDLMELVSDKYGYE